MASFRRFMDFSGSLYSLALFAALGGLVASLILYGLVLVIGVGFSPVNWAIMAGFGVAFIALVIFGLVYFLPKYRRSLVKSSV